MDTLLDLATKLDRMAENIPFATNHIKKEVATAILHDLTQVTPADVGSAISNWQVSIEAPVSAPIGAYVPSPRGKMVRGVWTHSVDPAITAQANAPPTFEAGKLTIEGAAPEQPLFISNPLPYIEKLDQGSSEQAPEGFVDRAAILGREIVARTKVLL